MRKMPGAEQKNKRARTFALVDSVQQNEPC